MLRFPYLPEPLVGRAPPSLPSGAAARWRPLVPVRIHGPAGRSSFFPRALVDCGADDTIFPIDVATLLGIPLLPSTGHGLRWRGQAYPLRFAAVELELCDQVGSIFRWPAAVGFSPASVRFPLLGLAGCLCFLDATLRGDDRLIELEANRAYPGTIK